ncbi:hypothetical protein [Amycolatopsis australiensis]|uniref:hypothetical protein n=1 Tax=Amycolatopsis australiensis TaxID=546364 RepID=UPI0009304820|nr:hypothetical protein [Amycolatopsis australiensis]
MAEVLVLVDHLDGKIRPSTFELLTVARGLGEPSAVAVGPTGTVGKLSRGLHAHGASSIYLAETDSGDLETRQVEFLSALLGAGNPVTLLVGSTARARAIAARVATRAGSVLAGEAVTVLVGTAGERTSGLACAAGYPFPGELDE